MADGFDWPAIDGVKPVWTGAGFLVGRSRAAILTYDAATSGWREDLTDFHEAALGRWISYSRGISCTIASATRLRAAACDRMQRLLDALSPPQSRGRPLGASSPGTS